MQYILALDQGTTSSRSILFDTQGQVQAVAQKEFEQHYPQPGWVEHDANEIWSTQMGTASEAMSRANVEAEDLAAIGITNQRETTVVWDRATGTPIHNAIVWQDRRTSGLCDRLKDRGHLDLIQEKTGLIIDAYFSGTKIKWLLDNVDGARERAENGELAFGTVDSWLVWRMTNGKRHVTDATNASRTLLYNIHEGAWDPELLDILDIPSSMLPDVRDSSEVYGTTQGGPFDEEVPIAGIAGDQQAALFGQMCTTPGLGKNTYGTGAFLLQNTGETAVTSEHNLLTTIAYQIDGTTYYALEGSIFVAGAVVQWLRDELKMIREAAEVERLARTVDDNGGVYFVPAFTGLGAPYWDQYARGTISGLTRGANRGHLARAAIESMAYQVADVIDAMEADSGIETTELGADGGAAANDLLLQFQSDILDIPVVRPKILETTALGAAYLAGLAVGYWDSQSEIQDQWELDQMFTPSMPKDRVETLRTGWSKALDRARAWESPDSSEAAPQAADVSTNATSTAPAGEESPAAS
ncbi:glycerol kinase GlpK [Salinibacter ruber]|uniref:glycerol kinase GlpK n=1 Tax=Salinibacter ruber TaxID=146919 RepID=UPI00216893F8|nr:glycerol kinase GlpK [Salinibacter ruber]MCS3636140.1 glycerol kinase [Salinibacter ruber]MCS4098249.1 glycerol kinase [Salinibacter ruber]MCS4147773.1 glycerol kinase [Salinibacter ruber]